MSIYQVSHQDELTGDISVLDLEHGVDEVHYPDVNPIEAIDDLHERKTCTWCDILRHNIRINTGILSGNLSYTGAKKSEKMWTTDND